MSILQIKIIVYTNIDLLYKYIPINKIFDNLLWINNSIFQMIDNYLILPKYLIIVKIRSKLIKIYKIKL